VPTISIKGLALFIGSPYANLRRQEEARQRGAPAG